MPTEGLVQSLSKDVFSFGFSSSTVSWSFAATFFAIVLLIEHLCHHQRLSLLNDSAVKNSVGLVVCELGLLEASLQVRLAATS